MRLTKLGKIMLPLLVLISIGWGYMLTTGFKPHKCEHIYTVVAEPIVDVSINQLGITGKPLVCVKCYNTISQSIIGIPYVMPRGLSGRVIPTDSITYTEFRRILKEGLLLIDSNVVTNSMGIIISDSVTKNPEKKD